MFTTIYFSHPRMPCSNYYGKIASKLTTGTGSLLYGLCRETHRPLDGLHDNCKNHHFHGSYDLIDIIGLLGPWRPFNLTISWSHKSSLILQYDGEQTDLHHHKEFILDPMMNSIASSCTYKTYIHTLM